MRRNKSAMFPYINGRCHANRLQPDGCAMSPVTTGLVKVTTFFILWMMEAESRLQCFTFHCVYRGGDALCELCRISVVVWYLVLYPHTFRDVRFILLNNFGLLEMLSPFAAIISPVLFPLVSRYNIMYIHIFVSWPCGSLHCVLYNVNGCGYFHKNLIRIIIVDGN